MADAPITFDTLPDFDDLPMLEKLGLRHAWDVFGRDDRVGTINLLTPERVRAAAAEVLTGDVCRLDLPLDLPNPPLFGREPYRHVRFELSRNEMDDRLDNFHLQMSTQWDALSHVRAREFGYYGGRTDNPLGDDVGDNDLGIDAWAERGIVGRGVLVDVARFLHADGRTLDPFAGTTISSTDLADALDAQGTTVLPGDILCVRLGWTDAYKALDDAARIEFAAGETFISGLLADEEMARWLWNLHIAALCADNPSVEALPGDAAVGSLHRRILSSMGMALGEMFDFDKLAELCAADGRYTFQFNAARSTYPEASARPATRWQFAEFRFEREPFEPSFCESRLRRDCFLWDDRQSRIVPCWGAPASLRAPKPPTSSAATSVVVPVPDLLAGV